MTQSDDRLDPKSNIVYKHRMDGGCDVPIWHLCIMDVQQKYACMKMLRGVGGIKHRMS